MTPPLVSVMMPCFNASKTLPWALASLLAQTYEHWECLLVDDGSTDHPHEVVAHVHDPRIKHFRLDTNMGRGVARQVALDRASGKYLCMLDADDWLYPTKFERQIAIMEQAPELALVSTGMAIVDAQNEIVGVRGPGSARTGTVDYRSFTRLAQPPVAHAPSMIRMAIAKGEAYDPAFLLSEDADFLLRILMDRRYLVLPEIAYVYSEATSLTSDKVLRSLGYARQMFRKHQERFPLASRINIANVTARELVYRSAFAVGLGSWIVKRRSQTPTEHDRSAFLNARDTVSAVVARLW